MVIDLNSESLFHHGEAVNQEEGGVLMSTKMKRRR